MSDAVTRKTRAYHTSEANYHEAREKAVERLEEEIQSEVEDLQMELKQKLAITELDSHILENLEIHFDLD